MNRHSTGYIGSLELINPGAGTGHLERRFVSQGRWKRGDCSLLAAFVSTLGGIALPGFPGFRNPVTVDVLVDVFTISATDSLGSGIISLGSGGGVA